MNELLSAPISYTTSVNGYFTAGDGGGGLFKWIANLDKSSANGAIIIDPSKSLSEQGSGAGFGCWVRVYNGNVNILWFGVDYKFWEKSGIPLSIGIDSDDIEYLEKFKESYQR